MRVGILFSGGKDSNFAIYKANEQGHDVKCLIAMFSLNPASFMFHTPNIEWVKTQAEVLEIPIILKETRGEKEKEIEDLKDAIKEAKEKYNLQGIVSGAIASNYQKKGIAKICEELGLESLTPLWGIDPEEYMKELIEKGFKSIISSISAEGLTEDFLGKEIDLEMLEKLKELNKKYGVHICMEGGEAETFVLEAPIFKKKLEVVKSEKIMERYHTGIYLIKEIKIN